MAVVHGGARPKPVKGILEFIYEVEGAGEFPFDMLRYDNSMPAREKDSYAMAGNNRRRVRLRCLTSNKAWEPTRGRWKSFTWDVVAVDIEGVGAPELRAP